jgi:hypothetical protein
MRFAFNELPQPVRERFVRIGSSPKHEGAIFTSTSGYLRWFYVVIAAIAMAVIIAIGSFLYERAGSVGTRYDKEQYVGLAAAWFFFLASAVTFVYTYVWKSPPYRRGAYLFPSYLVVVHGADLDIVALSEIQKPTVIHRYRNGIYQGSSLELVARGGKPTASFRFRGKDVATQAAETVFSAQNHIAQVLAARDAATLWRIDPFYECTTSGQWTEPPGVEKVGPLVARRPPAASWARWIGSLVVALGLTGFTYALMVMVCTSSRAVRASCQKYRSQPVSALECCQ